MNLLGKSLPPLACLLPFEASARLESFTRAADELHLSQAAVSRQIRELERHLGVKLFERRNRAVFLTAEGYQLAHVVRTALGQISSTAQALRDNRSKRPLVLLSQLCEAFYWLMPRLSGFHQMHPEIELQIVTTTQPLSEFAEHFDVGLQSSGRNSGVSQLVFTASDEVFPVCSPGYMAGQDLIEVWELPQHRLLHHRATPPHLMEWESWLAHFGVTPASEAQSQSYNSYPMMLQAAVEGHGMAVGWARTAGGLISNGELIRPCKESVVLPHALSVFKHLASSGHADETEALLGWLKAELSDEPVS
ncbi:LysR family transcriptional regulator [Pseudomonas sp. CDFA 602]|uniref:LysR family transcriptional regulator n=1 Tax=Pseudomonas californiensis TaxID=2829823 RepID=UPI001E28BCFC|nr:LysR family transcriptional regulator [Pseudomonas californiensis]MCD5994841.1 LysR family transcriptional regulator [Pseudomonas californiensis]MCD6000528.1 LysR family transcriptional regulator [Pseudomonas californiensis]